MPAFLVEHRVELDVRRLVAARHQAPRFAAVTAVVDAGIGVGRAGDRRQAVEDELRRLGLRGLRDGGVEALAVVGHGELLHSRSPFGQLEGRDLFERLAEVDRVERRCRGATLAGGIGAAADQVARQTAVESRRLRIVRIFVRKVERRIAAPPGRRCPE